MKLDFSLYGLLNHFLFFGLGFFIALVTAKKVKKKPVENHVPATPDTVVKKENKFALFIKRRIIRIILTVLYLVIFFVFLRYKQISYTHFITFGISFILFFLFFRLKKIMSTLFVLLIIGILTVFILFNRSLYLLFHEEVIGRIEIQNVSAGFIKMKITKLDDGDVTKVHKNIRVKGTQFGIFCYQLYYKKWLSFIGVEHKFMWAGVMGVKFNLEKNGRAKAKLDIYILDPSNFAKNQKIWNNLEQKELLLPGVRTVQRVIILKTPVKNAVYKIIKHRTGQTTIERKKQ
jgi:hypothetical protein